jgi:hypothetical protein
MKNQKTTARRSKLHSRQTARAAAWAAAIEAEDRAEVELDAQDADSVPQPIEDWSDDDEASRWLDDHRFDGGDNFEIH